jgi:hypothetical protein
MNRVGATVTGCLLVLTIASLVFGEEKKSKDAPLTGAWDCVAHLSGEDDIPFTMTLEQKGDAVTGKISTADGELEISSGSYKNGELEIHCETPEAKYHVTGKLDGGQLKGQWSKDSDGLAGTWEGNKSTAAKPPGL